MQTAWPTRPHPAMRRIWFWRGLGLGLLLAPVLAWPAVLPLMFALRALALGWTAAIVSAILLTLLAFVCTLWVWTRLAYRRYTFEIGEREVRIRKGIVFQTSLHIPYARVQDVVVRTGPLLRRHSLGSLRIQTASPDAANPYWGEGQLPGVREPERVAAEILSRTRQTR